MNSFTFYIFDDDKKQWQDFTPYAVMPLKYSNLLDEQLDECSIDLIQCGKETQYIKPLTMCKAIIANSSEAKFNQTMLKVIDRSDLTFNKAEDGSYVSTDGKTTMRLENNRITETKTVTYLVSNDKSVESPVGSGRYNHQLYLIELTKILEGFIGDSITFTNALGNKYLGS